MSKLALIVTIIGYLTTIVAFVGAFHKSYKKMAKKMEKIIDANLCELRSDLTSIYYRHVDEDDPTLREYERKNADALYEGYVALGGNSFVKDVYDRMRRWKVTT